MLTNSVLCVSISIIKGHDEEGAADSRSEKRRTVKVFRENADAVASEPGRRKSKDD